MKNKSWYCIKCNNMLLDVEYGLYYTICGVCWNKNNPIKPQGWDGSVIIKEDIFGNKWLAN